MGSEMCIRDRNTLEIIKKNSVLKTSQSSKQEQLIDISSEIQILFNLQKFLYKLFMNIKFEESDMVLKPIEKLIISSIIKKKFYWL